MNKKSLLGFLPAALAALLTMASCAEQTIPLVFTVNNSISDIRLQLGVEESVAITVDVVSDMTWTAKLSSGSWAKLGSYTVSQDNGLYTARVPITANINQTREERTDTLIVTSGESVLKVALSQASLYSLLSDTELIVTGVAKTVINISAKGPWTAGTKADWLEVSPESGTGPASITLTPADGNLNVGSREAELLLTIGVTTLNIPVTQPQTDVIFLDPEAAVSLTCDGGEFQVSTRFNVDYSIQIEEGASWLTHIGTKSPLNEGTELFSAAENDTFDERSAIVTFSCGEASPSLTVVQAGLNPILKSADYGFYQVGGRDYPYTPSTQQLSRLYGKNGKLSMRILDPGKKAVYILSGIDPSAAKGDEMNVKASVAGVSGVTDKGSYTVKVIGVDDATIWMVDTTNENSYFIVKK